MVDDEAFVLAGYRRTVGRAFSLTCAEGGAAGLNALQSGPFAVIITDMRMPHMNGLEFITAARARSRDSVFMMLTGNADQQTAADAINQGNIFRFLNKPCPPESLEAAIRAGIRQHELITAERVLLRETFAGSIKFMIEVLELANPELFALQSLVKQIQQKICGKLGVRCDWQLTVAGSLCLVGLMTIPGVSARNGLSEDMLDQAASIGCRLLSHIPRIGSVVSMIRRQREAAAPLPTDLQTLGSEDYEFVGAQLLRFCVDLAREELCLKDRARGALQLAKTRQYDPRLIEAFAGPPAVDEADAPHVEEVLVSRVVGMVVAADVRKADGTLLLSKGRPMSDVGVTALQNFANVGVVPSTIPVWVGGPPVKADI
jgi:CheY-like chemotaxis protein